MSVSYGIIKRHGGEILVESEPGKGDELYHSSADGICGEEEPEPKESLRSRRSRQARILVIDDEDSVRDILGRMLKAKGHQVAVASNGEEGIERFRYEPFDLVLPIWGCRSFGLGSG